MRGELKAFLKENIVLIAGISLPVLLALAFILATQIQRMGVEPPKSKVVFATDYFKNASPRYYPYKFIVEDNTIKLSYEPPEKYDETILKPQLFVYDPQSGTSEEVKLPEISDKKQPAVININDILEEGQTLATGNTLNGFTFEQKSQNSGNLMTELFGGGYRSYTSTYLQKGAYRVKIPEADYYNTELIAWIVVP